MWINVLTEHFNSSNPITPSYLNAISCWIALKENHPQNTNSNINKIWNKIPRKKSEQKYPSFHSGNMFTCAYSFLDPRLLIYNVSRKIEYHQKKLQFSSNLSDTTGKAFFLWLFFLFIIKKKWTFAIKSYSFLWEAHPSREYLANVWYTSTHPINVHKLCTVWPSELFWISCFLSAFRYKQLFDVVDGFRCFINDFQNDLRNRMTPFHMEMKVCWVGINAGKILALESHVREIHSV